MKTTHCMFIIITIFLSGLLLSCSKEGRITNEIFVRYSCDNDFSFDAIFMNVDNLPIAKISFKNESYIVPLTVSASGSRYASDPILFWIKSEEATLNLSGLYNYSGKGDFKCKAID